MNRQTSSKSGHRYINRTQIDKARNLPGSGGEQAHQSMSEMGQQRTYEALEFQSIVFAQRSNLPEE